MTGTGGRWAVLAVLAAAGGAAASGLKPASAPVPATQEIEVLDPGLAPTAKPPVVLLPCPDGRQRVDLPPAVLVHRYYYTGDRTFQAQMLPGGPVIVVVSHPKTLERVHVPLTLPPGAPKVTYTAHTVRYDYGPQSVTLRFGLCGQPSVIYSQCSQAGEAVKGAVANGRDLFGRLADGTKAAFAPVANGVRKLTGTGAKPDPDFTFVPKQ